MFNIFKIKINFKKQIEEIIIPMTILHQVTVTEIATASTWSFILFILLSISKSFNVDTASQNI